MQNDLEYMDDNAEKLGRKKMRTDAMKRQFAINGTSFGAVCYHRRLNFVLKTTPRRRKCSPVAFIATERTTHLQRLLLLQWGPVATSLAQPTKNWYQGTVI
jgi:hypothetical protein